MGMPHPRLCGRPAARGQPVGAHLGQGAPQARRLPRGPRHASPGGRGRQHQQHPARRRGGRLRHSGALALVRTGGQPERLGGAVSSAAAGRPARLVEGVASAGCCGAADGAFGVHVRSSGGLLLTTRGQVQWTGRVVCHLLLCDSSGSGAKHRALYRSLHQQQLRSHALAAPELCRNHSYLPSHRALGLWAGCHCRHSDGGFRGGTLGFCHQNLSCVPQNCQCGGVGHILPTTEQTDHTAGVVCTS